MLVVLGTQDRLPLSPAASSRSEFWSLGLVDKVRSTDEARISSTLSCSLDLGMSRNDPGEKEEEIQTQIWTSDRALWLLCGECKSRRSQRPRDEVQAAEVTPGEQ